MQLKDVMTTDVQVIEGATTLVAAAGIVSLGDLAVDKVSQPGRH